MLNIYLQYFHLSYNIGTVNISFSKEFRAMSPNGKVRIHACFGFFYAIVACMQKYNGFQFCEIIRRFEKSA